MEITVAIPPPAKTIPHLRAMEAYERSDYREAIVLYRQALEITQTAECWNGLGCSQFACILFKEAEDSFRRALELDPTYALAAKNLGALLISRKDTSEALSILLRTHKVATPKDQAVLAPLIEHCLKELRTLTQPAFDPSTRAPRILCMAAGFLQNGFSEANAREAWTLFESLREFNGEMDVTFASIETNISQRTYDPHRQIHGVPPNDLAAFVQEKAPDVLQVHFPQLSFPVGYGLQHQPTTLTLTDSDPLKGCQPEALAEVRHLIDCGRLTLICQSTGTLACLQEHGIRVGAMIPPVMATPARRIRRSKDKTTFVVGFATAPYFAAHWATRGVQLLLDLAAESPETQFLLAWRSAPDEIQKAVAATKLTNVTVLPGIVDMEQFYDQTDAIVLPFGAAWGNHNCPLSAVEGMLRGKPVLATEFVGIADWLQQEGAGVVAPPTVQGLRTGLLRLQSELSEFSRQARLSARSRFDHTATVNAYKQVHRRAMEKDKGPTLNDWENRLEAAGKTLARGRPALARFYESRAVAQGYIKERFGSQHFSQFEKQERAAIEHLIASRFGGRTDLMLLDLATGPGRLLPCLIPFGTTTGLDGSAAMLEVARAANPSGVKFVRSDVFNQPSASALGLRALEEKFHVVTCGRLLRHLEYPDRRILYRRFQELLRDDGIAIIDVPNPGPEYPERDRVGWENYPVYDVFWTLDEFRHELSENGFALTSFVSVGTHASSKANPSAQSNAGGPIEYVVAFTKKP